MIRYNRAYSSVSNESDEAANIGLASGQHEEGEKTKRAAEQELGSGHYDPAQRRNYVGLLIFSIISALTGLILIITWMFKYRAVTGVSLTDAAGLSNLHPIMMFTFMISLNMYAILVYRTHYNQPKERLKWTHAILAGVNIVMSLLGVFAMLKAHLLAGIPNFYSMHSWIGSLTNAFYLTQFVVGCVAFLKPGLAQHYKEAIMPWHRILGSAILVLAALAAITGISELVIFQDKDGVYSKFTAITFIANFAGISVFIMTTITIYLVSVTKYRRPQLVEEVPLKR